MRGSKVLQASLVAVAAILLSVPSSAVQLSLLSAEPPQCPRTVAQVLSPSVPDGAELCLDGMLVAARSRDGKWLFVRDPYSRADSPLLPVYANVSVERYWSIEIQGYKKVFSLPGSVRTVTAVIPRRLRLYVDAQGRPFLLYVKNPMYRDPEWSHFRELPVPVSSDGMTTLEVPIPPPEPDPPPDPPSPSELEPGTIPWALRQPVETLVTIYDVICTADSPQPGPVPQHRCYDFPVLEEPGTGLKYGYFYVTDRPIPDPEVPTFGGSCGIRIKWDQNTSVFGEPQRDKRVVLIAGRIEIEDGEKQIKATSVQAYEDLGWPAPKPRGMNNRTIGGNSILPGQAGEAPGVKDPDGLYNKGLLIRAWGIVRYVDPAGAFCYIDDGSVVNGQWLNDGNTLGPGGTAIPGVRVILARSGPGWQTDEPLPQVGQYVAVKGISSSMLINNQPVRLVRQRSDYGRVISQDPVNFPYYGNIFGRGLMKTDSGDMYFTMFNRDNPSEFTNVYKYQQGFVPLTYAVGHVLGCLDLDNDGATFWGGSYGEETYLYGDRCRLYRYQLPLQPPPAANNPMVELNLDWLAQDPINYPYGGSLDGLAVDSTDGTFWVSSDLKVRVYRVDRNGNRIGSFDMPFEIAGHDYAEGYLWLVQAYTNPYDPNNPLYWYSKLHRVDLSGSVVAWFEMAHVLVEDLDWRSSEPKRLRGFTTGGDIVSWDLTAIQVLSL